MTKKGSVQPVFTTCDLLVPRNAAAHSAPIHVERAVQQLQRNGFDVTGHKVNPISPMDVTPRKPGDQIVARVVLKGDNLDINQMKAIIGPTLHCTELEVYPNTGPSPYL